MKRATKTVINKLLIFVMCAGFLSVSVMDASAQRSPKNRRPVAKKVQNVKISLTERGYQPETFRLKKGIPARVTFIRTTEDDCGKEVVIPAYNIRRELPLNKPVTISFTPRKAGSFNFVCGMDMLRGNIIVR